MADTPAEIQQELFDQALAPEVQVPQEPAPAEPPAPVEPPSPPPVAPPAEPPAPDGVPSWRLREEAERARQAEQRATLLEARLNEITTHLRQSEKKPDFFADPDNATQAIIERVLEPVRQEQRATMLYLAKMVADQAHGADKVLEAEQAFLKARDDRVLDVADYERVVTSPNRYDAVVQWHKRQTVLASVGDDPAAWFEKQLEAKLADPAFQASLMEKARAGAAKRPSDIQLPPSLSKTPASAPNGGAVVGDMSHGSLWENTMKP